MNRVPIRVLHLEDDPDYADLVKCLLETEGIAAQIDVVADIKAFRKALESQKYAVILADYLLPCGNGLEALELARSQAPETPFLLVSGTIGEQAAVQSLKTGATDYVLKQLPDRLVPSIRRAVEEAAEKRERRRIQEEYARREQYFRTLTENALDVLVTMNKEGRVLWCSPSVERVLGYAPDALVGSIGFALVHSEDQPKLMEAFHRGLTDPTLPMVRLDLRVRHRQGTWRYLEALGQNRCDDPELGAVLVTLRDISERKQAEAERLQAESALRSSEMLFRSVWENSVDGMRLTDQDGKIVAVNQAFCSLVRMRREELEGAPLTVAFAGAEKSTETLEDYGKEFARRVTRSRVEHKVKLRDDSEAIVEETSSFVEVRDKPPLLFSLFRDVGGRKLLEDQLRQAQKMEAIGQLAGGVAHDFNNILTVIHGHASLLLLGGRLDASSAKSAQQISQAAERAAALTRQLLAFSRRQVMQLRVLDMNEVVSHMTKMLSRILGEDIALQLSYCPAQALIKADSGMMEQVLLNLAVNSRDAMPKGGLLKIRITVREFSNGELYGKSEIGAGRFVCVSVTDTGCGIEPENLRHIFEPFFTTKEVGKGTGLGLATVYGIARQHQGWVEAESVVGKGSTFSIFLPETTQALPVEESSPEVSIRGGTETILVVEDEGPVRDLVCTVLERHGYRILQASSGPEAIGVWKKNREGIDLLLTDIVMPDRMNGRDLAQKLWADRPDLKVLFSSGYSPEALHQDPTATTKLSYLQKPYHPSRLASAVRSCLDMTN